MHLAVEQGQKPLSIVITAGQRGDSPQFEPVLEAIRVPRFGRGRSRRRPDRVRADKAYDSRINWTTCVNAVSRRPFRIPADPSPQPVEAQVPGRSATEVRQDRLTRASRRRVWDQPSQALPCRGHEVRQARRSPRGDRAGRSPQRVAVTSTNTPRPSRPAGAGFGPRGIRGRP
ncbi:transposase [Saccharopolyspora pogona]|uniref:transposase n=1 Tax=Saccharopolyspora pogona TaxID=333966 RepID=UPI0037CAE5B4